MPPRAEPQTILVYVGLDLIGDGLMKLPFAQALRNAYPHARITWLAGKGRSVYAGKLKPLVDGLIDEVIDGVGIGSRLSEVLSRPLDGRRFDLVLDTQQRVVTTLVLRRIRHGCFVSGCAGFLFSDLRPAGTPAGGHRRPAAMIDRMLALIALARHGHIGAPLDTGGAIALPGPVRAAAARLLPDNRTTVALAPGAGRQDKCWPREHYAALAERLAARGLTPVIILGPDEAGWLAPIRAAAPGARFPLAEAGARLDLEPLLTIGLAARCAVCVANDSGIGHLFAASGSPLVSLFGPTSPTKFAPRAEHLSIIRAQSFGGQEMAAIPLDAVEKAVLAVVDAPAEALT